MNNKVTVVALVAAMAGAFAFGFSAKPEQSAELALPSVSGAQVGTVSKAQVEANLQRAFGGRASMQVKEVAQLANGQILEVVMANGQVIHLSPDMKHVITGGEVLQLQLGNFKNLTQARMDPKRAELMAAVDDSETVIFKAEGEEKGLINVFTDIDCGYCRKLHKEVPELNKLGITVRYLAYPRAGEVDPRTGQLTSSFKKIKSVWCNDDPAAAMTKAKLMQQVPENLDCDAPITAQFNLGQQVGVTGTPAIVFADGTFVGGYKPAGALAQQLLAK